MDWSTDALISEARLRGSVPPSTALGSSDSDFIRWLNAELRHQIAYKVIAVDEGYLRRNEDRAIVSGATAYSLPRRALAGRLYALQLIDSSGRPNRTLGEITQERESDMSYSEEAYGFFYLDNQVKLVTGSVSDASTIRFVYYRLPSELVLTTNTTYALPISTASHSGSTLTITTATSMTASPFSGTTSTYLDLVQATPPFGIPVYNKLPATISGTTATFTISASEWEATSVSAGDYVCKAGYAPVATVPEVFWTQLSQRAVCRYLKATGKLEDWVSAKKELEEMEAMSQRLISPRSETAMTKIVPRFGFAGWIPGRANSRNSGY